MSSSSEEGVIVLRPLNPDVPQFEVIPRRKWDSQWVALHNIDGVKIAEGLLHNIRSSAMAGSFGPLDELDVVVQVSRTFVLAEAPDEWRYSFVSWPMQRVFLDGTSLLHHIQCDTYNMWMLEQNRPVGGSNRRYSMSSRSAPPSVARYAQFLMTPPSINAVASNTCCSQNCIQYYPREKIKILRMRMYDKTKVRFRNHIKLDVHRQFHRSPEGRRVVTLGGVDVCAFAWMCIMGVSSSTFYRHAEKAGAGHEAQDHGNSGLKKPRSNTVVATAVLGSILEGHADHMPHKTRVLPNDKEVVGKVLHSSWVWKDQLPVIGKHLAECGLPPISSSKFE